MKNNIEEAIVGKSDTIQLAIITLLARGHLLIEDVPGVGKTSLAHTLAKSLNLTVPQTGSPITGPVLEQRVT
ncbi:MAG: hypothetical protein VX667_08900 [Nitrospinota bacterium]|nr:hypothetical protein [Nitrospinota bacterium]